MLELLTADICASLEIYYQLRFRRTVLESRSTWGSSARGEHNDISWISMNFWFQDDSPNFIDSHVLCSGLWTPGYCNSFIERNPPTHPSPRRCQCWPVHDWLSSSLQELLKTFRLTTTEVPEVEAVCAAAAVVCFKKLQIRLKETCLLSQIQPRVSVDQRGRRHADSDTFVSQVGRQERFWRLREGRRRRRSNGDGNGESRKTGGGERRGGVQSERVLHVSRGETSLLQPGRRADRVRARRTKRGRRSGEGTCASSGRAAGGTSGVCWRKAVGRSWPRHGRPHQWKSCSTTEGSGSIVVVETCPSVRPSVRPSLSSSDLFSSLLRCAGSTRSAELLLQYYWASVAATSMIWCLEHWGSLTSVLRLASILSSGETVSLGC